MTPILSRRALLVKRKGELMKRMERVYSRRIWQYYKDRYDQLSEELATCIRDRKKAI